MIGEYDYAIDEKGRLNFPAKFRSEIGSPFIITRWLEKCLIAFSATQWDKVYHSLCESGLVSGREARRFLFSAAAEVAPDKQGRILVPPALRGHASLERDVTIVGNGDYAEIWDTAAWRQECEEMDDGIVAAAMEKLGL